MIANAIRDIKSARNDIAVISDICLCAYTSNGHCGLTDDNGLMQNDETLKLMAKMAVVHAAAGADMVAPSAMADGQVATIRQKLDENNFSDVAIMSYAAKFASAFYEPFRNASKSAPQTGDRTTHQLEPGNANEAIRYAMLDEGEGADWLMVKPAMPYLDIVQRLKQKTALPVAAYQVSGEYAMIKAAAQAGFVNEKKIAYETVLAMKRAGATAIITYYAEELIKWLAL